MRKADAGNPEAAWDARSTEKTVTILNTPLAQEEGDWALTEYIKHAAQPFHGYGQRAVEYIKAGDIFQVVLSQRFPRRSFTRSAFTAHYGDLIPLLSDPWQQGDMALVAPAPKFWCVCAIFMTIRPIAGTSARCDSGQDQDLADELIADVKERAEPDAA